MRAVAVLSLSFLVSCSSHLLGQTKMSRLELTTTLSIPATSSEQGALNSLMDIGFLNTAPMGIVIEGDSLCTHRLHIKGTSSTAAELIAEIKDQIPGYVGELQDQTIFIHPDPIGSTTYSALDLVIPTFKSPEGNVQEVGVSLWMYIRALLVPREGSGFVGGSSAQARTIPSFTLSNITVQKILNRIVTTGMGGLWSIRGVSPDWLRAPNTIPYRIVSYADGRSNATIVGCARQP